MLSRFRDWMIRRLGGVTAGDHEAFRVKCRDFAELHWGTGDYLLRSNEQLVGVRAEGVVQRAVVIGDWVAMRDLCAVIPCVAPWNKWFFADTILFPEGTYTLAGDGNG